MKFSKIKSYAKINLSLNVIKKLKSNFHNIESIVSFVDLHDVIYLRQINLKKHKVFFKGRFSKSINNSNTVTRLLEILDKKKIFKEKKFELKIIKNIPQKSGLGGGSMNASSLINYFIKKKIIKLKKIELEKLSYSIGSDVILGINPKNTILLSNGKIKRFEKKLNYFVLIVKPVIGCSTSMIYKKVRRFCKPKYNNPRQSLFKKYNLINSENELENVAFKIYPILKKIKLFLLKLSKVEFVRMTGSGSSVVAYFDSKIARDLAAKKFKKKFNNYWCIKSKTV